MISLGGASLPDGTDVGAAAAFFDSIASVNPIPPDFGAPGEQISLSGLLGVTIGEITAPPEATGDPAVLTWTAYAFDYDENDDIEFAQTMQFAIALPAADAVFSYEIISIDDDGTPLVELGGTEPYAALLNGLDIGENLDTSIARLMANGVSYDVLLFIDREGGTDYLIQIGGDMPLPLGTVQQARDFRLAVENGGSIEPIPAGDPLAPGAFIRFSESPWLIGNDGTPQSFEGGDFTRVPGSGSANYGVGSDAEGSLTIVNGFDLVVNANGERGPFMNVGRGYATADTDESPGLGTVTVAGPGSTLSFVANGSTTEGASINIGRDGGSGFLRALDGGRFEITDPVGDSAGPDLDGAERFNVGRGADGRGYIEVNGGSVAIIGTSARATFGRGVGSEGRGTVADGVLRVQSTTDDAAVLRLGYEGGVGQIDIREDSRVFVQAGEGGSARLEVGLQSGGAAFGGILNITGTESSLIVVGGGGSDFVAIDVGKGANSVQGRGLVQVTGGAEFGALNRGFTLDDNMVQTATGAGGAAEINIGRNSGAAGIGEVVAINGGEIFVSASDEASLTIGDGAGSNGLLTIENSSELRVLSENDLASIYIGTSDEDNGAGGTSEGRMFLRGEADVGGGNGAAVTVGDGADNLGELTLQAGGILRLMGEADFASLVIGGNGGLGTLNITGMGDVDLPLDNTTLDVTAGTSLDVAIGRGAGSIGLMNVDAGAEALFESAGNQTHRIGWEGGTGTLNITDGAAFEAVTTGADSDSLMGIGTEGGTGTVTVDFATLEIAAFDGAAGILVGIRGDDAVDTSGTGTLVLENDASVFIDGATEGILWVGGGTDSVGVAEIRSGAGVEMGPGGRNAVIVGGTLGEDDIGGGQGRLTVTGTDSDLSGAQAMLVGINKGFGTVEVLAGGRIDLSGNDDTPDVVMAVGFNPEDANNPGVGQIRVDGAGSVLSMTGAKALAGIGGGVGGTGQITIANGGLVEINGDGAVDSTGMGIGGEGGSGIVLVNGTNSALRITDNGSIGGSLGIAAEGAGTSFGLLQITAGAAASAATVTVGTVGESSEDDGTGVLVLDAGVLTTGTLTIAATGLLGGIGTVTGNVIVADGGLNIGDTWNAEFGRDGGASGQGTLRIEGNLTQTGGEALFDFGDGAGDLLEVTGALSFTGTEFSIDYNGTQTVNGFEIMLAQATAGITLTDTTLMTGFDIGNLFSRLETRADGKELWFVTDAELVPQTVTLSGIVGIREVQAGSVSASGTLVTFTEANGFEHTNTTDATGAFSFELKAGTTGTLELVRTYSPPPGPDTDLTINDVQSLFRMVAGVQGLAIDPRDFIAGDFNQNGTTNIADVLELFRFVAGVPGAAAPKYVFIDTAEDLSGISAGNVPQPMASFDVTALNGDASLNFLGILGGDLQNHV
jgi:hypothetical protein